MSSFRIEDLPRRVAFRNKEPYFMAGISGGSDNLGASTLSELNHKYKDEIKNMTPEERSKFMNEKIIESGLLNL